MTSRLSWTRWTLSLPMRRDRSRCLLLGSISALTLQNREGGQQARRSSLQPSQPVCPCSSASLMGLERSSFNDSLRIQTSSTPSNAVALYGLSPSQEAADGIVCPELGRRQVSTCSTSLLMAFREEDERTRLYDNTELVQQQHQVMRS